MANNSINFNIGFKVNDSGLKQVRTAIDQLGNLSNKELSIINTQTTENAYKLLQKATAEVGKFEEAMTQAYNVKLGTANLERFNEELRKNGTSIEQFRETMMQLGPTGEQIYAKMATGLMNVKYQTVETTTLMDKLGDSLRRSLLTFTSINIINKVKGSIGEAYGYVKNLDTSLNDIRIVTGKSADEMDRFAESANKAAAKLGKATTDYTKASTIFYQQGLSDTEVQSRTEVALKVSNTTGADTTKAADQLTAIWNGFNVGAEDAEKSIDVIAAVAANTASNLDEMSTAMSRVASMANSMGVSEEQLASQISTVIAVTRQAPESVGTAFKTIYARIADIKAGSEDAEISLGNYSGQLAALGINVLDTAGNLKDMGQIIEEVGTSWGSYSKEQQVAIAGIMGGQRQVNQLRALFDNWDKYTEAMKIAADAEGTLQQQQDTYMESTEGQLQMLRTEWEGVLDSLLKAEDIINVAKKIQPILVNLEKLIDAFGGGIGILQKFSPLLIGVVSPQISQGIGKLANSMMAAKTNAQLAAQQVEVWNATLKNTKFADEYSNTIKGLEQDFMDLSSTLNAEQKNEFQASIQRFISETAPQAEAALKELNDAYKEASQGAQSAIKIDPQAGIKDAVRGYEELLKYQQEYIRQTNDFLSNNKTDLLANNIAKDGLINKNTIQGTIDQLSQLNNALGGNNEQVQNAITEFQSYKDEIDRYREALKQAKGDEEATKIVQELIAEANQHLQQTYNGLRDEVNKEITSNERLVNGAREVNKVAKDTALQAENIKSKVSQLKTGQFVQSITSVVQGVASLASAIQQLKNLGKIWTDEDLTTGEKLAQILTTVASVAGVLTFSLKGAYDSLQTLNLAFYRSIGLSEADIIAKMSQAGANEVEGKTAEIAAAQNLTLWASLGPIALAIGAIVAVIAVFVTASKKAQEENHKAEKRLKEINKQLEETTKKIEDVNSAWEDYKTSVDALSQLKRGTEEYANAVVDLNNKVLDLIDTYPELAAFMKMTDGGRLEISTEGWEWLQDFLQNQKLEETREQLFVKYDKATEDYNNYQSKIDSGEVAQIEEDKWLENYNKAHNESFTSAAAARDFFNADPALSKIAEELENNKDADLADLLKEYSTEQHQYTEEQVKAYQDFLKYDQDIADAIDVNDKAQRKLMEAQQKTDVTAALATYKQYNENYSGEELNALANVLIKRNNGDINAIQNDISNFSGNKDILNDFVKANKQAQQYGISDITKVATGDVSSLTNVDFNEETTKILTDTFQVDPKEIIDEFNERYNILDQGTGVRFLARNLGIGIAEKFNKDIIGIDDELEYQLRAGTEGLTALDSEKINIETFTDLLSKADTQEGLDAFNAYLEQAKINFDELPPVVQNYINELENLNTVSSISIDSISGLMTVMSKTSSIKFGDTFSAKDFEEIQTTLEKAGISTDKFFTKVGDKFKFISADAKEFAKAMDDAFIAKVKEAKNEFEGLNAIKNISNNQNIPSSVMNSAVLGLGDSVLNSIEGWTAKEARNVVTKVASGTATEEEVNAYDGLIKKIQEAAENDKYFQEKRAGWADEYIGSYIHSLEELEKKIDGVAITEEDAERHRETIRKEELSSLNMNEEAYKSYLKTIKKDLNSLTRKEEAQVFIDLRIKLNKKEVINDINNSIKELNNSKMEEIDYINVGTSLSKTFEEKLGADVSNINMTAFAKIYDNFLKTNEGADVLLQYFKRMGIEGLEATNLLDEAQKQYNLDLQRTQEELRKTALEQQRTALEAQKSLVENRRGKIENRMSHASGSEYSELRKQRENYRQQEFSILQQTQKLDLQILQCEKEIAEQEAIAADVEETQLNMTYEQIQASNLSAEKKKAILALRGYDAQIQAKELTDAQELEDFYEQQYVTISKITDEQRELNNIQRQFNRLQKEAEYLTGEDLVENLKEQNRLRKDTLETQKKQIEASKQEQADAKEAFEGILKQEGFSEDEIKALVQYDLSDGIANMETIFEDARIKGSDFAEELNDAANKVNDLADQTADLEDAFEEATRIFMSFDYDQDIRKKSYMSTNEILKTRRDLYDPTSKEYKDLSDQIGENSQKYLDELETGYDNFIKEKYNYERDEIMGSLSKETQDKIKTDDNGYVTNIYEDLYTEYEKLRKLGKDRNEIEEKRFKELNAEIPLLQQANDLVDERLKREQEIVTTKANKAKEESQAIKDAAKNDINELNKQMEILKTDQSNLYGDNLISNLESQRDVEKQIVDRLKEQKKEAEALVKTKKEELAAADEGDKADAQAALAEAEKGLKEATEEYNKEASKSIQIDKEIMKQKVKIAEDAIKRETDAQHQLKKALKDVDRELNQVKKDQDGLTGQALISKLQEEISIQEKKKKILEQQLAVIKAQIQQLIALYSLEFSKQFNVPINFVVDETGVANLDEIEAAISKVAPEQQALAKEMSDSWTSTLNSLASNLSSLQSSIDGMSDSIDSLNKKIKETAEAEKFRVKEEKWDYLEAKLKLINKELERLQRLQKHLTGEALIKNLTQQQKILEKQAQAQANKLAAMKAELQIMQQILAAEGVAFDSDGLVSNFAYIFAQGNEKLNGYIKSYQSLYATVQDLESSIAETYDKQLDLEYEKAAERLRLFNAKIDVELDLGKAKREWQNFKREFLNTLNDMQALNDSLVEKAKQGVKEIIDMSAREAPMLTDHVNQIMSEIHLMQAGGWSNLYGTDQEAALSDLANYRQQLQDTLSSISDKIKEVNDSYLQQIEKIQSKFDEQIGNYEQIQSIIEHDMNLIKFLHGDKAYEELANYYDKSTKNYEAQLKDQKYQVEYWKRLMDSAQPDSEAWNKFQENWKNAVSKLNSTVDSALENLLKKYENAINSIANKLENKITDGNGFDWNKQKWDWDKEERQLYLDDIGKAYNIEKLRYKYQKAANEATNPNKQAKVLKIMDEELGKLKAKDKLTKYEVERAEKVYELKMKQLELEDAANNKTKMRLRRDTEGNYRYEYVADEDKIAELKQEILDLQEEIRQFDLSTYEQAVEEMYAKSAEAIEKIKELAMQKAQGLVTDEEFNQRYAELVDHYGQVIGQLEDLYDISTTNLTNSSLDELVMLGEKTKEEISTLTDFQKTKMTEEWYQTYNQTVSNVADALKTFTNNLNDMMIDVKAELDNYVLGLQSMESAAGISFETVVDGIDTNIDAMDVLIEQNDELLLKYEQELQAIEELIHELDGLEDAYMGVYEAAVQAVDAALELRRTEMDYNDNGNVSGSGATAASGGAQINSSPSTSNVISPSKASIIGTKTKQSKSQGVYHVYYKDDNSPYKIDTKVPEKGYTPMGPPFNTVAEARAWWVEMKKNIIDIATGAGIASGATGMYTGEWGSEGKLAVLHEKELVLNKTDTANILEAVKAMRQGGSANNYTVQVIQSLADSVNRLQDNVASLLDIASTSLLSSAAAASTISNTSSSSVTNNINANFPNAGNMNEIQNALMNLPNYTSQKLHSNQRGKSGTANASTLRTKSF